MLVRAGNKLFDAGGRGGGIEEFGVVVLVGLKELGGIDLAPNTLRFKLETAGCVVELDRIIGVDGNDVVCVTCGGDRVGEVT